MSSDEVDKAIQRNIPWSKLTEDLKIILGNSQREYDKRVLDFSIKNQIRYKGSIVKLVKKSEEDYYENLLTYSRTRLMLYPYHLSDIIVRGLRVTPFNYYINMMVEVMTAEKSYDSLPNFTAADAVRLLGIGRNQYIDLMNQNRSFRKLFRRSKSIRDILPQKPTNVPIEAWYHLCHGCVMEHDIKLLTTEEKEIIDRLVDNNGPIVCGELDKKVVEKLYHKGLVYLDVPISDIDYVYVPTLDGFVMNRVQGDFFETLLYKVFVTLDGQTSPKELADMIEIDEQSVKNAISVFCRLGFARKRLTGVEDLQLHASWLETGGSVVTSPTTESPVTINAELFDLGSSLSAAEEEDLVSELEQALKEENGEVVKNSTANTALDNLITPVENANKRIAFIFDSTLTAFLMMGNLSTSLKNHAVTLFEVGKLADESIDSFVEELQNVNFFVEGEAQRYSEHARTLLNTIQSLRTSNELDLIRGESLLSLDPNARVKVLQKSYKLLVSMSPISSEACTLPMSTLPYYGAPCVELTSYWLRLLLYGLAGNGPPTMLLPMGTRVHRIPELFWKFERVVLSTGIHEPIILTIDNCAWTLNEMLLSSPVLVQAYSNIIDDSEIVNVPFPFQETDKNNESSFVHHAVIQNFRRTINLDALCGYIVLLKLPKLEEKNSRKLWDEFLTRSEKADSEERSGSVKSPEPEADDDVEIEKDAQSLHRYGSPAFGNSNLSSNISKDPRKIPFTRLKLNKGEALEDFVLFDCIFGIPLFSEQLNEEICRRIQDNNLLSTEHFSDAKFAIHNIVELITDFVKNHTSPGYQCPFQTDINMIPYPTDIVIFDSNKKIKILKNLF